MRRAVVLAVSVLVVVALLVIGGIALARHREAEAWDLFWNRQARALELQERGAARADLHAELGTPDATEREGTKEFWIYRVLSKGRVKRRLIVTLDAETGRIENVHVTVLN